MMLPTSLETYMVGAVLLLFFFGAVYLWMESGY